MEVPAAGTATAQALSSHHEYIGRVKQGRCPGVFVQTDKGEIFVLRTLHESMGFDTHLRE